MFGQAAYLLNPPRKRRKARRVRGRGRARGVRRMRRTRRRKNVWKGQPRKHARAARKGWARRRRRKARRRKASRRRRRRGNPPPSFAPAKGYRRKRRKGIRYGRRRGIRRRNPDGAIGRALAVPTVLPIKTGLPGFLGTAADVVIQTAAIGLISFVGFVASGTIVDMILSRDDAAGADSTFTRNWARPLLFAGVAGLTSAGIAMAAPRGRKAAWALVGAAGPGLRAVAGFVKALIPADTGGMVGNVRLVAEGLADYLQVEGSGGNMEYEDAGVEDYLQVGGLGQDIYEAGMEDIYEAGLEGVGMEQEMEALV